MCSRYFVFKLFPAPPISFRSLSRSTNYPCFTSESIPLEYWVLLSNSLCFGIIMVLVSGSKLESRNISPMRQASLLGLWRLMQSLFVDLLRYIDVMVELLRTPTPKEPARAMVERTNRNPMFLACHSFMQRLQPRMMRAGVHSLREQGVSGTKVRLQTGVRCESLSVEKKEESFLRRFMVNYYDANKIQQTIQLIIYGYWKGVENIELEWCPYQKW